MTKEILYFIAFHIDGKTMHTFVEMTRKEVREIKKHSLEAFRILNDYYAEMLIDNLDDMDEIVEQSAHNTSDIFKLACLNIAKTFHSNDVHDIDYKISNILLLMHYHKDNIFCFHNEATGKVSVCGFLMKPVGLKETDESLKKDFELFCESLEPLKTALNISYKQSL